MNPSKSNMKMSKRQTSLSEHLKQKPSTFSPTSKLVHSRKEGTRVQDLTEDGKTTTPRVAFLPEPYPVTDAEKKKSRDHVRTHDVRYSLAFQLSADYDDKSSALHRRTFAALKIVQIVDAAARLLREDMLLRPWRDCMSSSFPAEKISIASEWRTQRTSANSPLTKFT